ncbi:MAG: cupredoxin domain-containing protein [Actinomycetota bacterium]|nr:cupredoxin domain-containing protein [Actinomycetota bacterium]
MRITQLWVAPVLVAGAVACASSDDETATPNPTPAPSQESPSGSVGTGTVHDVSATTGNHWSPSTLTLKAGDSVKVTDVDPDAPHNFVVAGVGRSKTLNEDDTFTLTFPTAGTFDFVCTFHETQGMVGTITVS